MKNMFNREKTVEEMVVIKMLEKHEVFSSLKLTEFQKDYVARCVGKQFDILVCLTSDNKRELPYEILCEFLTSKKGITFDIESNCFIKDADGSHSSFEDKINPCCEETLICYE